MSRAERARTYTRAFLGLLARDVRVLRREFLPFLLRTVMNPLLFVFVFAYVFPRIGQGLSGAAGAHGFATILVPGLVAVGMIFQGIAAVALPLVNEIGRTKEIEDRLMAPIPIGLIAVQKIVFAAIQSVLAALVVFPLVYVIPATHVEVEVASAPLLAAVLVLGGLVSGAFGLVIGASFKPQQVPLIFSIIVVPTTFLGCVYYPWAALGPIPWLKVGVLFNPLVYVSEGLRAALTPGVDHMPVASILVALLVVLAALAALGWRAFVRRVTG
jgi:ABC-2 type transport system permease protein